MSQSRGISALAVAGKTIRYSVSDLGKLAERIKNPLSKRENDGSATRLLATLALRVE